VLNAQMPLSPGRIFNMQVKRTAQALGTNQRTGNEEIITSRMGPGRAPSSTALRTRAINNVALQLLQDRRHRDPQRLHQARHPQCRHADDARPCLIDIAGYKGVETLDITYEVSVADLEGAMKSRIFRCSRAMRFIINTGWGKLWGKDNERHRRRQSRPRREGGRMADRQGPECCSVADTGAGPRSRPNPDKLLSLPGAPDRAGGEPACIFWRTSSSRSLPPRTFPNSRSSCSPAQAAKMPPTGLVYVAPVAVR